MDFYNSFNELKFFQGGRFIDLESVFPIFCSWAGGIKTILGGEWYLQNIRKKCRITAADFFFVITWMRSHIFTMQWWTELNCVNA